MNMKCKHNWISIGLPSSTYTKEHRFILKDKIHYTGTSYPIVCTKCGRCANAYLDNEKTELKIQLSNKEVGIKFDANKVVYGLWD